MLSKRLLLKKTLVAWGVAGTAIATLAIGNNALATDPVVHPANLISGECGTGTLTVAVGGAQYHVKCANVDTHTGEAFFHYQQCYGHGHKHHCYTHRKDIQLPVLKVTKVAYKKDRVITTNASDSFHVNVADNGSYYKNLSLKSKQKKSLIVSAGHYSIYESAAGYDESIRCGDAGQSDTGSITVGVNKGAVVDCTVINKKHPAYAPAPPPPHPTYHAPKHCEVTVHGTLSEARVAYSNQCSAPRKDCDEVYGGWTCSSKQIGSASPG